MMLLNINTYLPRLLQFNQMINHSYNNTIRNKIRQRNRIHYKAKTTNKP